MGSKEAIIKKCPKSVKDSRPDSDQVWCLFDHNGEKLLGRHPSKEKVLKQERAIQIHKRVAFNYLSRLAMEFPDRMKLVKEHEDLAGSLEHLEKRYNIDKISDPPLAIEVKAEIKKTQDRIKEILDKLSF